MIGRDGPGMVSDVDITRRHVDGLLGDLEGRRLDRDVRSGWERRPIDTATDELIGETLNLYPRIGKNSVGWVDYARRRRLVTTGPDRPVWPVPDPELARTYLATSVDAYAEHAPKNWDRGKGRIPWRKEALPLLDIPAPHHFAGPVGAPGQPAGAWTAVDITACYWSLLSAAPLDLEVRLGDAFPRVGVGVLWLPRTDELAPHKPVRNTVWGSLRVRWRQEHRHGTPHRIPIRSPHFAPDAASLVVLTAQAIAWETIHRFGAISWSTDGGILPADQAERWTEWLAERWGLTGRTIATGPATVLGAGRWTIGPETRGRHDTPPSKPGNNLLDLTAAQRAWLTNTRHRLATTRPDPITWPDTAH